MQKNEINSQRKNLVYNIIDELNNNDIPKKILQPCVDYITTIIKPYYTIHMICQLVIICLLLVLLYLEIRKEFIKH